MKKSAATPKSMKSRPLFELKKLAEDGDAEAQFWLGSNLSMKTAGDYEDEIAKESFDWTHKAAKQGHAGAAHNLGFNFSNGLGCKVDGAKAVKWYTKAYQLGELEALALAADILLDGTIIARDIPGALAMYTDAAHRHPYGYYKIGRIYEHGVGVKKNSAKALDAYTKGALLGHSLCLLWLGQKFIAGDGVAKDEPAGLEMLLKACENKHPDAFFAVAEYLVGLADPEALSEAEHFYQVALQFDHPEAQSRLEALQSKGKQKKAGASKRK